MIVGSVIHLVDVFKFEIMCRFQKIQYWPTSYLIAQQGNYNSEYLTTGVVFTHSPSLRVSSSEGSSLKLPHSPHNLFFSIVSTSTSPYAAPSHVNYQYSRVIRLRNIYMYVPYIQRVFNSRNLRHFRFVSLFIKIS